MTTGEQGFQLDELTTGSHAHGFGRVGDGRDFAFRVRASTVVLEVYRADSAPVFPVPEDVVATASRSVAGVDLDDRRGVEALVRDLAATVEPADAAGETTVRAFLGRLSSVVDSP